ncbi:hypothetical protein [Rhodococcus qingshengii]|uniref:hypothetical protein n=1 Tax=Rhodococcus qingshengii TaxID=334542 RepID=UPI001F14713B|nr:hypothetical protein [Rhodococcus qingshengii]ULD38834.1 hypothetical protein JKI97_00600 [Rhodococcus qingshengii]
MLIREMVAKPSVTDQWLATAPHLPALTDPAAVVAERLLLLLHYGMDWTDANWVAARRGDYWDHLLPAHVRVGTYSSGTNLHHWWTTVSGKLGSAPRTDGERLEVAQLLTSEPNHVIQTLRDQTMALVLRTRIVADAVRTEKGARL